MNFTAAKSRENIDGLISPYCGELVNLLVEDEKRRELTEHANKLPSLQLSPRSLCDLESYRSEHSRHWIASWARLITRRCSRRCV